MFLFSASARKHLLGALLAGLALRLFFVWRFPTTAGDTAIYEELARNWLDHFVYGLTIKGQLVPADLRAPGYPAFLASIYLFFGRSQMAIMLAQVFVDLGTCLLTALLAAALVPEPWRRRVAIPALWLAATCPILANYAAVPLAEVLSTFLTTAVMLWLVKAAGAADASPLARGDSRTVWAGWLVAGLLVGLGTLVRPEAPLLLVAAGIVMLVHWRKRVNWPKLLRAGALLAAGFVLPLLPWAARNWITLHKVQFLAARYAEMPGEFVSHGFFAWTKTWLWRYRDCYTVVWKYDDQPINMDDIPSSAFDTPEERERVAKLIAAYNEVTEATPEFDRVFAQLAAERTARHPLRTYLWVPLLRSASIWLTPRVALLPVSGNLWPLHREWDEDRTDLLVTLFFGALGFFYIGLALVGLYAGLRHRAEWRTGFPVGLAFFLMFLVVRTAFLTQVETPEPRYVNECFPIVLVLGALAWILPNRKRAA